MGKRTGTQRIGVWRAVALLSFLLAVSVGWIVFDHLFSPFGEKSVSVEIPDYCGRSLSDIEEPDWVELQTEYRYDPDAAAGVVLSQSPSAGSRRKLTAENPQCALSLVVSLGKETLTLPDVVGQDARETVTELRAKGFLVETVTKASSYPEGTILSMEPRGGTELPKGARVVLTVSEGYPNVTVTVPDLRGLTRSDALVQLWLSQLTAGEVIEIESDEAVGTVVSQSHRPGTLVVANTRVTLYVSRGIED